jgi:hypothetical protein
MNESPTPQQQRLVWWVLWAAFQVGIVVLFFVLRKPQASTPTVELWQVGFLPVLISGALRWTLLPMIKDGQKALAVFVIGIALAEMSCFLGLFIFRSHQFPLFIASLLGIFQYIPVFVGRYYGTDR